MFYPLEGTSDPSTDIAQLAAASQPTAVRNIEREREPINFPFTVGRSVGAGRGKLVPGRLIHPSAVLTLSLSTCDPLGEVQMQKRHIHKNVSARNTAHWPSFSSRHKQSTGLGNITGYSPPDGKQFAITETQRNAAFQWKLFAKMLPAKTQNNCPT